jgi:hypothetical protein
MRLRRWVAGLSPVVVLLAGMQARAADVILAVDLAKLAAEQLASDGWGEPTKIDDRACRVAGGGNDVWLRAEAWWKEGLRPAEKEYFLAEIVYKDTATKPILFKAWAGIGGNESRTEMHRFGGLNDGRWKTAQVPLGWDMLMVRPGTRSVEFSIEPRAGDVPVASMRVLPLAGKDVAAAAEQWNAETRAWVRQVQKRHDGKQRKEFAPAQKPAESVAKSDAALVPYVRTYMSTVYPYSAPQQGETGIPLKAQMARNEYEPAAFGVYAPKADLTNVTVKVEPLRHASDAKASLAAEVRTAEYALSPSGSALASFPQRLWPMYATAIKKGQSGWFWVTFHSAAKTTPAGLYRGQVTISSDQGQASLDVEVRVLSIELVDMNDTDLRMGGCITGMVSRHDMDNMLRYNHNQVQYWFSGVQPKFIVKKGGDFDLDFTILDDQFEQARKAGIQSNVYFLGGNPYGFPGTQTLPRELARQVLGMTIDEFKDLMLKDPYNVPEQIVPLYKKWVAKVMQHAKEKNWPEQILTPFDEPDKWRQSRQGTGKWIRPQFEQCCNFIHEAWPETRVYGSMHHAPAVVFLPVIDIFCTNAVGEDPLLGDKVRAAGKTFWQYSGGDPASPADRARYTFGFYFHSFNSRGSLCWAYNWFDDRFDNSEGNNWGYGWYTPTDVIPAPFYEGMREGWDDRRYIETLRKVGKQKGVDVEKFLDEIGREARANRGKGGEDTVDDFWDQARQVGQMDTLRQKVAAKILEVQAGKAAASQPAAAK